MKLRSKLLLSATCLLTISVAATATSAYAWFTANRQAFVSATNMSVKSGVDEVFISSATTGMSNTNTQAVSGNATYVGTDVSGTGLHLYKPSFKEHKENQLESVVNSIAEVTTNTASGTGNKNAFYNEISLKFTHENTNVKTAIYLSSSSTITKASDNNATDDTAGAYRVAFLNKNKDSLLAYYAPNDELTPNEEGVGGLSKHISSTSYEDGAKTSGALSNFVSDTNVTNLKLNANQLLGKTFTDVTDADKKTNAAPGVGYLGTIDNTNGLEIVVRIWCEGMDSDCNNNSIGSSNSKVNVNLKFNGVTHTA
ncbi:MAG: hypothetical protein PUB23_00925 [Bacilli bacterium]|nr:hypothetical protein [Bacilli bacterium]